VAAVLACPAWLRGGTPLALQGPFIWMGVLLLALFLREAPAVLQQRMQRLRRDPVVYMGAAFLVLLLLQWWNAGRAQLYDYATQTLTYSAPPHPGWPSAFTRDEAGEMLRWFFPAWALLLVVRAGVFSRRGVRLLFLSLVLNAALLALVGLLGFFAKHPVADPAEAPAVFADFGYANHAGAFFALNALLAAGLLMYELVGRGRSRKRWGTIIFLGGAVALTMIGSNLSMSRAGMLSCAAGLFAMVYGLVVAWPRLEPPTRLHVVIGCLGGVCLGLFIIDVLGQRALARKVDRLVHLDVNRELAERGFQARAALRIWLEQPWFGVGGWGYRYLLESHIEPEYRYHLDYGSIGKANVHNDPLQFLAEFGLVGAGLLAALVLTLLRPLCRRGLWHQPLVLFALIGLGLTFAHSLIDLPFRCPAIIWLWVTVLAALPFALTSRAEPPAPGRVRAAAPVVLSP
jgi:O-antigen ligase